MSERPEWFGGIIKGGKPEHPPAVKRRSMDDEKPKEEPPKPSAEPSFWNTIKPEELLYSQKDEEERAKNNSRTATPEIAKESEDDTRK